MASIQVLAIPTMGLDKSWSVYPMPFRKDRAGARARPCRMVRLLSGGLDMQYLRNQENFRPKLPESG